MRGTGHARALTIAAAMLAAATLAVAIAGAVAAQGPSVGACPLPPAGDPRLAQEPTDGPLLRYRFCAGWQAFPYPEATPATAADLAARFGPGLAALWRWDNPSQRWQLFSPRVPARVNQFDTVRFGDGLLVHMDAGAALLRFQLPPDPTYERETVDFPGGSQWIAFPWRGRYGRAFDLVEILARGSSVLIHCDPRVPTGWCGSRSDETGASQPINARSEDLVLAHWDLVFVQHADDVGRGISARVVSARETFSRPHLAFGSGIAATSLFVTDILPEVTPELQGNLGSVVPVFQLDGRWVVGVSIDEPVTWGELTRFEFTGVLSAGSEDIPEREVDRVGDDAYGSIPVDRFLDVFLRSDLLPRTFFLVGGPGTITPQ